MRSGPGIIVFICFLLAFAVNASAGRSTKNTSVIIRTAIEQEQLSSLWKAALTSRMSKTSLDSFASLKRSLSAEEIAWKKLIESKAADWNHFRDSLATPFAGIALPDTIFVWLGFLGVDDGFTYEDRNVCIDLTALYKAYGNADLAENSGRIDRIFAHEYTHLLHKSWAVRNHYQPLTFRDSILWECLYEGIGMYRSLNARWMPQHNSLPSITSTTLAELYPIFTNRMVTINVTTQFTESEKERLHANLSRGNVNKKWGAFPMAIWLLLEAKGDERNLIPWINKGPSAVLELAATYLPPHLAKKLVKE